MSAKRQRLRFVLASIVLMALAAAAILRSFQDSLVFFYTPSEWQEKHVTEKLAAPGEVSIGGLVKTGSVKNLPDGVTFVITDLKREMKVTYHGLLPSLFREGQGVVAQGQVNDKGELQASTILAKHDENYMPKEVVDQLKQSGHWQDYGNAPTNETPAPAPKTKPHSKHRPAATTTTP